MSRKETFIPRHMASDLLPGEEMGVGAEPEIADAGDQVRVQRRAGADIDRGHDLLEAVEVLRLLYGEIANCHDQAEHGADHAEIDERVAGPSHGLPVLARHRDEAGHEEDRHQVAHARCVGRVRLEQKSFRPRRRDAGEPDQVEDGEPRREGERRGLAREGGLQQRLLLADSQGGERSAGHACGRHLIRALGGRLGGVERASAWKREHSASLKCDNAHVATLPPKCLTNAKNTPNKRLITNDYTGFITDATEDPETIHPAERSVTARYWKDLTTEDFAVLDPARQVAILPVAAVEQHGPHLPLGTDAAINTGIVARAVALMPMDTPVLVLPLIQVGLSPEHRDFPGTLTLSPETLLRLVIEIAESVARAGLRKIILFNSHGGQPAVLDLAAQQLRTANAMMAVVAHSWRMMRPAEFFPPAEREAGIHAGANETSLLLHLHPGLVRRDRIARPPSAARGLQREHPELARGRP